MCDGAILVWRSINVSGEDRFGERFHKESVLLGEVLVNEHSSCSRVEERFGFDDSFLSFCHSDR